VEAAGARYAGRARAAGEDAGVPAPGQVQAGFDAIQKAAEEEREAFGRMVDAGERRAREDAAPVRDEVEAKDGELSKRLLQRVGSGGGTRTLRGPKGSADALDD